MKDTQLRLDQARWWALTNQPFYGALAMNLPDVIDPSTETAHTDGRVIAWNPGFIETLNDEELRFVLLHETLHCAHQHMWRLPLDQRGNTAGDHEINLTLKQLEGISMPEGGLADSQYEGMACEDILNKLPKPDDDKGSDGGDDKQDDGDEDDGDQSGSGAGGSGGQGKSKQQKQDDKGDQSGDGSGQGDQPAAHDPCGTFRAPQQDQGKPAEQRAAEIQELRDDWDQRVMQAAQAAQALGVGDVPADLQRILDKIHHREVDWRREMADFVKDAVSSRNDWSRSARRHAWQPVIYPRRQQDSVGTVIFVRDTSGSISDEIASAYSAMITDCIGEMNCRGLVLDCDTQIQAEYEVNAWEQCPLRAKGGGGTRFQPAFDKADEMVAAGETVAGVVYLTDMAAMDIGSVMSDLPTLWMDTAGYHDAPFGRSVRIEL